MEIKSFEELQEAVNKLNNLLKDPQPGIFTWCDCYGELMTAITNYWKNL